MKRLAIASLLLLCSGIYAQRGIDSTREPVSPSGTPAVVDIPSGRHIRNAGGSDGLGLCVFTSFQLSADWQNVRTIDGFRKWMESQPGGGYPEKLDKMLEQYASMRNIKLPDYVQHTGGDAEFLDMAMKTGRCVCVTYAGVDGFYNEPVAHMVNLAHLDKDFAAIIDNNRPGLWVWMTRNQFLARWKGKYDNGSAMMQGRFAIGGGWAVVLLNPPPPPRVSALAKFLDNDMLIQCTDDVCKRRLQLFSPSLMPLWKTHQPTEFFQSVPVDSSKSVADGWYEFEFSDKSKVWKRYDSGKLMGIVDEKGEWHKAVGPNSWESTASEVPVKYAAKRQVENIQKPKELPNVIIGNSKPLEKLPMPKEIVEVEHVKEPEQFPTGVIPSKVEQQLSFSCNGANCSKDKAYQALFGTSPFNDDSSLYHLTIVGTVDFTYQVKADLAKLDKSTVAKMHVQVYSPTDWPVGFFRVPVGVTLRKPTGNRQSVQVATMSDTDYKGPESLDAILRTDGEVLPKLPDVPKVPTKPAPQPTPDPSPEPSPAPSSPWNIPSWLTPLLLLLIYLRTRK